MGILRIGTAGIPASTKPASSLNAIKRLHELGLKHMELEFVRGVKMGQKTAEQLAEQAEKYDISLTVHAPYYVNLNSAEPEKVVNSKNHIFKAAQVGAWAGAKSVTFHPAFYHDDDPEVVYERVREQVEDLLEMLDREGINIRLSRNDRGPIPFRYAKSWCGWYGSAGNIPLCDFAHLFARSLGEFNSYSDFSGALEFMEAAAGRLGFNAYPPSGIEYGPRGERTTYPSNKT